MKKMISKLRHLFANMGEYLADVALATFEMAGEIQGTLVVVNAGIISLSLSATISGNVDAEIITHFGRAAVTSIFAFLYTFFFTYSYINFIRVKQELPEVPLERGSTGGGLFGLTSIAMTFGSAVFFLYAVMTHVKSLNAPGQNVSPAQVEFYFSPPEPPPLP
ncbi:hypothetical protein QMT40_002976 [Parvibaculaceae bacterium PLY_AMNH_Bact1]|nr:hypothetical protein QMT40_002976 [Parvibaculaceae bacterium PLY_AMNH_Bact1]